MTRALPRSSYHINRVRLSKRSYLVANIKLAPTRRIEVVSVSPQTRSQSLHPCEANFHLGWGERDTWHYRLTGRARRRTLKKR